MKKTTILIIALTLIIVGLFSGCTEVESAAEDTATCCVIGVIGVILFIILIAYLLGGKKTKVETIIYQQAPPAPPPQQQQIADRICPSCKRPVPFDAYLCPYCGKRF